MITPIKVMINGFLIPAGLFLSFCAFCIGLYIEKDFVPIIYYHDEYVKEFILVDSFYTTQESKRGLSLTIVIGQLENDKRQITKWVDHKYRLQNSKRIPIWCRFKGEKFFTSLPREFGEASVNREYYIKRILFFFSLLNLPFIMLVFILWKKNWFDL